MLNRFSRTELLVGNEAMEKLKNSRVAVFGIGGVGGYTVEALVRSGIGTIDIIDDDKVCPTNINRQIIATTDTIGKFKVDVAEERIKSINPDCVVYKHQTFYSSETADEFDFSKYDYVVDAIDTCPEAPRRPAARRARTAAAGCSRTRRAGSGPRSCTAPRRGGRAWDHPASPGCRRCAG